MGLTPGPGEGGTARRLKAPPSPLAVYVTAICILGLTAILSIAWFTPWYDTFYHLAGWSVAFLAVAAIVGEVKPLIIRTRDEQRTLSTSAPFLLALIPIAGVGIAVAVQAVASLADDIRQRRPPAKSLFNTAQYALSVVAARGVYVWLTGQPYFAGPKTFEADDIGALLAAGATLIGVNWLLVAGVISFASGQSFWTVLKDDAKSFLTSNVVLLSVGAMAATIAADGILALAMLATPVVAAHVFAAAAARHAYAATHDSLTGLLNRSQLHDDLDRALADAPQAKGLGPGLVILDLDHFKDINDTLGHPVGDQILRDVAKRLAEAAPDEASVHRLGGDEYAVIVPGTPSDIREATTALLASLDTAVSVDNLELLVRASAGVAIAPQHGTDSETLLKNADIALYHAKLERDRISTYSPGFDVNTVERLRLLTDLRTALDNGQLSVMYQPQVDLRDGRTVGVEALVRWVHPERGRVGPDEFIPLAENSGLIFPLTAFVLDTALAQLAQWRASGHDLRMAVNLSARHLSDLALPDQVSDAAARHGIPLEALVLEVTETAILSDPTRADAVIRVLRSRGVEVSIDDYGTGNASLSYLKRLEIDELKIDRSFVSNLGKDAHDLIIVRSTIALGLALGLRVVAEGIEDGRTTAALADMGGVIGQGYHLGRPTVPAEIDKRLAAERGRLAPASGHRTEA